MAALKILRPGMLTTVQDCGRWGHQARGVPVSGAMDVYSHRLANLWLRRARHEAPGPVPNLVAPDDVQAGV